MNNIITNVKLDGFMRFEQLDIDFSPKINVIVGENGVGKTQLLKAIYFLSGAAALSASSDVASRNEWGNSQLVSLFKPIDDDLGRLVHRPLNRRRTGMITGEFPGGNLQLKIASKPGGTISEGNAWVHLIDGNPIFIPTKEVMSLFGGINALESDRTTLERLFDQTYFDLCSQLNNEPAIDEAKRIQEDPKFGGVLEKLSIVVDGKFIFDEGRVSFAPGEYVEEFKENVAKTAAQLEDGNYEIRDSKASRFVKRSGAAISSHMAAEGIRKLGVLQRLLQNNSLLPGVSGPLLWDEPETNMNPRLLRHVVEVLIELSRNGQQIIVATHDYVLLKWFDLLLDKGKGDHARFHTLHANPDTGSIDHEGKDEYSLMRASGISDAFAELYDADVKRALG